MQSLHILLSVELPTGVSAARWSARAWCQPKQAAPRRLCAAAAVCGGDAATSAQRAQRASVPRLWLPRTGVLLCTLNRGVFRALIINLQMQLHLVCCILTCLRCSVVKIWMSLCVFLGAKQQEGLGIFFQNEAWLQANMHALRSFSKN